MRGAVVLLLVTLSGGHITPAPAQGAAAPVVMPWRFVMVTDRPDTLAVRLDGWRCAVALSHPPMVAAWCPMTWGDSLRSVPGVRSVEWDELREATAEDAAALPWNLAMIGADTAWNRGITGTGVRVGVIDSGIDVDHPDLRVVGGRNFSAVGGPDDYDDTVPICKGHGTHAAGSVGSKRHGVAPGVDLYALKVFENMGGKCLAWTSMQVAAVTWAGQQGLDAVNISIAGTWTAAYAAAIVGAVAAGTSVVAAAGNNDRYVYFPGAHPQTIAVAALTSSGARASFSNQGPEVTVAAPGSGITSSMPGGGTGGKSGTSMASPHVAGVVALLRQARPDLTPPQITALLIASAVDISPVGFDNGTGWGRVDVPRLLALVIPRAPMVARPPATAVGVTRCMAVSSAGPWVATTAAPLDVWQSGNDLCWRGDVAGVFSIRLRSL